MSKLSESIGKKFVVTTEVKPPRGPNIKDFLKTVDYIKHQKQVTAVNVIDSPSARLHMSSLGASIILKQKGVEPIFQMVCRDRNALALESDIISAQAFGIENVLALTGDHPARGASDHPNTMPVYDLDSTSLIKTISMMNEGIDITGKQLNAKTDLFVGGALTPTVKPMDPEVLKVRRKLDAGAEFFQTQVIFDIKDVEDFMFKSDDVVGDVRKNVIVGLIPLSSQNMINFLNKLPGIHVPESIAKRVSSAKNAVEEGIFITLELIDQIKFADLAGVHIMPVGRIDTLERILKEL